MCASVGNGDDRDAYYTQVKRFVEKAQITSADIQEGLLDLARHIINIARVNPDDDDQTLLEAKDEVVKIKKELVIAKDELQTVKDEL